MNARVSDYYNSSMETDDRQGLTEGVSEEETDTQVSLARGTQTSMWASSVAPSVRGASRGGVRKAFQVVHGDAGAVGRQTQRRRSTPQFCLALVVVLALLGLAYYNSDKLSQKFQKCSAAPEQSAEPFFGGNTAPVAVPEQPVYPVAVPEVPVTEDAESAQQEAATEESAWAMPSATAASEWAGQQQEKVAASLRGAKESATAAAVSAATSAGEFVPSPKTVKAKVLPPRPVACVGCFALSWVTGCCIAKNCFAEKESENALQTQGTIATAALITSYALTVCMPGASDKALNAVGVKSMQGMGFVQRFFASCISWVHPWFSKCTGCLEDWLVSFMAGQVFGYATADVLVPALWRAFPQTQGLVEDAVDIINALPIPKKDGRKFLVDMGDIDAKLYSLFDTNYGFSWLQNWSNSMISKVLLKTSKERLVTLFAYRGARDGTTQLIKKMLTAVGAEDMANNMVVAFGIRATAEMIGTAVQVVATGGVIVGKTVFGIRDMLTGDTPALQQKRFERKQREKAEKRKERHAIEAPKRVKPSEKNKNVFRLYDKVKGLLPAPGEAGSDEAFEAGGELPEPEAEPASAAPSA